MYKYQRQLAHGNTKIIVQLIELTKDNELAHNIFKIFNISDIKERNEQIDSFIEQSHILPKIRLNDEVSKKLVKELINNIGDTSFNQRLELIPPYNDLKEALKTVFIV